jgi:hypothetical protein
MMVVAAEAFCLAEIVVPRAHETKRADTKTGWLKVKRLWLTMPQG